MKKNLIFAILCVLIGVFCLNGANMAIAQEKFTIRLAHVEPEERALHKGCLLFKQYVELFSDGRVTVEIYPNAQLGGDRQALEAVSVGTIEMTAAASAVMSNYDPNFGILDLPFIFKDREATIKACDGKVGKILDSKLPAFGMIGLGYCDYGQRHMTNNVRPINEPNDMKGLKIRVMENPVYIELMRSLGANPTPMSFGELYTALQQGVVDGQENPMNLIYSQRFYEVQKYLSLSGHFYYPRQYIANANWFDNLSDEHQKIIAEAAREACNIQREELAKYEIEMKKVLQEKGMEINEVDKTKFIETAQQKIYPSYYETVGGGNADYGKELVERIVTTE